MRQLWPLARHCREALVEQRQDAFSDGSNVAFCCHKRFGVGDPQSEKEGDGFWRLRHGWPFFVPSTKKSRAIVGRFGRASQEPIRLKNPDPAAFCIKTLGFPRLSRVNDRAEFISHPRIVSGLLLAAASPAFGVGGTSPLRPCWRRFDFLHRSGCHLGDVLPLTRFRFASVANVSRFHAPNYSAGRRVWQRRKSAIEAQLDCAT